MLHPSLSNGSSLVTEKSSASAEEPALFSHPLYRICHYIWVFGLAVIILLGNFGNLMTLIIMRRKTSGDAVISIYFSALAAVDLVSLDVLSLGDWIGMTFGYRTLYRNDTLCKIHNWTVSSTTTGGWVLVSLTLHRAISVVWPHRVNSLCTRRLVVGLVLSIGASFAVLYSHYLYGYGLRYVHETGEFTCLMKPGSYVAFINDVFTYVDMVLYSVLPFTCIFIANVVLIWKLRATIREMGHALAESESVVTREKAARSVTVTIITVSIAYVVLTLPATVYFISMFVYDPSVAVSVSDQALNHLTRAITFLLMHSNNAVNFYLYCLTGNKFRKEFAGIFCPTRRKRGVK